MTPASPAGLVSAARPAILADGLVKTYGAVRALDGVHLEVAEGTVLGLLGPNGAGKTTTVRILSTLLTPDAGTAFVGGVDVLRHPDAVRRMMGLSGQYAAVDEYLTGRENLVMFGQLYHLGSKAAKARAGDLLEQFALSDAADRVVKTYSGGMRRRLDLASALVARPRILFLDEPTTGLDPRSRMGMWEVISGLVHEGATVLLTTQYLEEADELAHRIAVIDRGRVIAEGTSDQLKAQVGGERIEVVVHDPAQAAATIEALRRVQGGGEPVVDLQGRRVRYPVTGGARLLVDVVRELDGAGVTIDDIALRRPTLDDVFLTLTGHAAEDATADEEPVEEADGRRARARVGASAGRES
ncbi:MAG: ATP-binding cassette domain-containing protein [Acidimicrobiales bacterium]